MKYGNQLQILEPHSDANFFDHDFLSPTFAEPIYTNNLKNREFDKEAFQIFDSERATIAERQGASENKKSEIKPTLSKTDPSGCLCIERHIQNYIEDYGGVK